VEEFALSDVSTDPDVAAALERSPALWRSCMSGDASTGGRQEHLSLTRQELVDHVWLEAEEGRWTMALGDELFPLLDLDDDGDFVLTSLQGHADVAAADHEDRELFVFTTTRTLTAAEAAVLALVVLTAAHSRALRSVGPGD
jgi:hypothetical protein